jgi:hypothetical protein
MIAHTFPVVAFLAHRVYHASLPFGGQLLVVAAWRDTAHLSNRNLRVRDQRARARRAARQSKCIFSRPPPRNSNFWPRGSDPSAWSGAPGGA